MTLFLLGNQDLVARFVAISFSATEQVSTKDDEKNCNRADVKAEQSAVEKNQQQDYNPQNIAACVASRIFEQFTSHVAKRV